MSTTRQVKTERSTGTGREVHEEVSVSFPSEAKNRTIGLVGVLSETVGVASFTDGGAAAGTYQMAGSLPAGAVVIGTKVLVPAGFAGDTSAAMTIGDGSDVDRYNTSTIDVFSTAATGVQSGVPSGNKLVVTANRPTLTVTTNLDFTAAVTDGSGSVTVNIYYVETA